MFDYDGGCSAHGADALLNEMIVFHRVPRSSVG